MQTRKRHLWAEVALSSLALFLCLFLMERMLSRQCRCTGEVCEELSISATVLGGWHLLTSPAVCLSGRAPHLLPLGQTHSWWPWSPAPSTSRSWLGLSNPPASCCPPPGRWVKGVSHAWPEGCAFRTTQPSPCGSAAAAGPDSDCPRPKSLLRHQSTLVCANSKKGERVEESPPITFRR